MSATTKNYVTPQSADVLAGRSVRAFTHQGNRILRFRIVQYLQDYKNCTSRKQKTGVIRRVLQQISAEDGRFLRFDKEANQWFDAGFKEAHAKIASNFRDAVVPDKVKCLTPMKKVLSAKMKPLAQEDQKEKYGEPLKPQSPMAMPTRALAEERPNRCFSDNWLSGKGDIFEGNSSVLTEEYVAVRPDEACILNCHGGGNLHQQDINSMSLYEHLTSALAFEMSKRGNPCRQEVRCPHTRSVVKLATDEGETEGPLCPLPVGDDLFCEDFLGDMLGDDLDVRNFHGKGTIW